MEKTSELEAGGRLTSDGGVDGADEGAPTRILTLLQRQNHSQHLACN